MSEANQKIEGFLRSFFQNWGRKGTNPVAWGIILLVTVLIAGVHFLALAFRPDHLTEMTAELGSVARFIAKPDASGDGSYVSFSRGTDAGGGLFVCNPGSGQQQLLFEDSGRGRIASFGWSPDGKMLAFTGLKNGKTVLMAYDEHSGQVQVPTTIYGSLNEFEWLSPSSFVFLKGSGHLAYRKQNAGLMRVDKIGDGVWSPAYFFAKEEVKTSPPESEATNRYIPIRGLMATSPNSVAWMAGNAIWELKFHDSEPALLWDGSVTNKIISCSYSGESGAFLLRLRNGQGQYLASYSPFTHQFVDLGGLASLSAVNVSWINHGKGYAYLVNETDSHCLFVKADQTNALPIQCIRQDGIRDFTAAGNSIYAYGRLEEQPEGVVEYDAVSGAARYVVPTAAEFRVAKNVMPSNGIITNSFKEIHTYHLWPPVNFNPRKKYPLVLAQQRNIWNAYAEAVANAGGFYINVDRPDSNHPQIKHWAEDVMAAWHFMRTNPNVDASNVYLSASNDEAKFLGELLKQKPSPWKGVVLISPLAFPDLSRAKVAKALVISGEFDENNTSSKIKQFQKNAARAGIPVTIASVPAGHVLVSGLANKRSIQEFVQFLFE